MTLHTLFVVLHITTAAAWFGLGLRLAGKARTVLSLEGNAATALAKDTQRTVKWMSGFIILTVVFAYTSFFIGGGFTGYPPQYHASLTLMLVLVAVQFFIHWSWNQLTNIVANGASPTSNEADSARKKVAIGTGVGHLLWVVLLVLMYFDTLVRPFFV